MTNSAATTDRSTTRLPRRRLRRVDSRDRLAIAVGVSLVVFLSAGAWTTVTALRPLRTADSTPAADHAPPTLSAVIPAKDLDDREVLLARIDSFGNVFAVDRQAWATLASGGDANEPAEATPDPMTEPLETVYAATGIPSLDDVGEIMLSKSAPQAITRDLGALSLNALYGIDGDLVAVIRDATVSNDMEKIGHYRVGDAVGSLQWRLLAIDPNQDRVIVERAGHTLELRMFPLVMAPVASAVAAPITQANERGVIEADADAIRIELAQEGFTRDEIDDLLRLAEQPAPAVGVAAPVASNDDAPRPATPQPGARAMPAEMVDLLRMMAADAQKASPDDEKKENDQRP